jgi:hypothetical protein
MKIYTVYKNKIAEVDIKKETKNFYIIPRILEFSCLSRIEKKTAHLTPQSAIDEVLAKEKQIIFFLAQELLKIEEYVNVLNRLAETIRKEKTNDAT